MSFTGRGGELDQLNQALTAALDPAGNGQIDDREGMVIIPAIAGVAGVGKTALAVHRAHRVAANQGIPPPNSDSFPSGSA
jgi:hypothetical protein